MKALETVLSLLAFLLLALVLFALSPLLIRLIEVANHLNHFLGNSPLVETAMNSPFDHLPVLDGVLRRARLATARFALKKGGALLRAGAPLVVRAGQQLEALSEHPALADPPAPPTKPG